MKMPCDVERHGRNIHWRFHGKVDTDQQIELFGRLYGHECFDTTRGQVRNYSGATDGEICIDSLRKIAAYDRAAALTNPKMKIALIMPDAEEAKALASLYQAELSDSPWQVEMFDCELQALEWVA